MVAVAAGEVWAAGEERERLRRGAGKGAVSAHVAGEGGRVESLALEGQPILRKLPAHEALMGGDGRRGQIVRVFAGPGIDGDLADEERAGQGAVRPHVPDLCVPLARGGGGGGDDFHHAVLQGEALLVIRRAGGVGALAFAAHVADGGDGARAGIVSLDRPRGAGGVVRGAGEGKIGFHVPLQVIKGGTRAADFLHQQGIVGDFVGQHMPVAGRGFGVRAIRPEFGEHAEEVGPLHRIRGVGLTGDGIERTPGAVVVAEGVVAIRAGRKVHHGVVIELRSFAQHIHEVVFVGRIRGAGIARRAEPRGSAVGIVPGLERIGAGEAEGRGGQALHADVGLRAAGQHVAGLVHDDGKRKRLPEVRIRRGGNAVAQGHVRTRRILVVVAEDADGRGHVRIHRAVVGLRIGGERKAVAPVQQGLADAFAQLRRRGVGGQGRQRHGGGIAHAGEPAIESGVDGRQLHGVGAGLEPLLENAVGGVADGFAPGGQYLRGAGGNDAGLLVIKISHSRRVIRGPRVIHGHGSVE